MTAAKSPEPAPTSPSVDFSRSSAEEIEQAVAAVPWRSRLDHYLTEADTIPGRVIELTTGLLIIGVCAIFAVTHSEAISPGTKALLEGIETGITVFFLFEYLLRWWAKGFSWRYPLTPMAIIDFVAVLPLLPIAANLQFVRVLRLFRILRLLRLVQSRRFFFGEVTPEHLIVLRILFTIFCLVFITGGLIYELEHDAHPDQFKTLYDGIYFAIVTLTTVGFGDLTPVTWEGRAVTMIMILSGVIIFPWQLTNLARAIVTDSNKIEVICRSCGLRRHDQDASHCKACGNLIYQEYDGA